MGSDLVRIRPARSGRGASGRLRDKSALPQRKLRLESLENRLLLASFLVTATSDDGPGSLRQALLDANGSPGADIIELNIGGGGHQTIQPLSALPKITEPVTIDGTTQAGYAGTPIIELDGTLAGDGVNGLKIAAADSVVRGLVINRFSGNGIVLDGSVNCAIEGNFIGIDASGTIALPNGGDGLEMRNGASGNRVGTDGNGVGDQTERNVISGNAGEGVSVYGEGTTGNVVAGNLVGTSASGNSALGNGSNGIAVKGGATFNIIGTNADGVGDEAEGNVVSGNGGTGIGIWGPEPGNNRIAGNLIGTNLSGASPLGNLRSGVGIWDTGNNQVGGRTPVERNIISGNAQYGVMIQYAGAEENVVQGNYIGTDATGTVSLGNQRNGISVTDGATANTIGGTDPGARNVVSGNGNNGIAILRNFNKGNVIVGNFVGTDASGTSELGNGNCGIRVTDSSSNAIGTGESNAGNLISGNGNGILIEATPYEVFHWPSQSGGNGHYYVVCPETAWRNAEMAAVKLGGHLADVVDTAEQAFLENYILANPAYVDRSLWIGLTDQDEEGTFGWTSGVPFQYSNWLDGEPDDPDGGDYVAVNVDASEPGEVGGWSDEVNWNISQGIIELDAHPDEQLLEGIFGAHDNSVAGNLIGLDVAGSTALGNGTGISIVQGASDNRIGGLAEAERNTISANRGHGLNIRGAGTNGNLVLNNYIGTDATGAAVIGNQGHGVIVADGAAGNIVGGTVSEARNVIVGNSQYGISLNNNLDKANSVSGNYIGTTADGTPGPGNQYGGISIVNASGNVIGGAAGNLISGNEGPGARIAGSEVHVFQWAEAEGGNNHYYIVTPVVRWITAEEAAVMLGGHLASITSQEEQDFVNGTILAENEFFSGGLLIGLHDAQNEGDFRWISGEEVGYTNWQSGQPDNEGSSSNADFVAMHGVEGGHDFEGAWADHTTYDWFRGLIELETAPDPALLESLFSSHGNLIENNSIAENSGTGVVISGNSAHGNTVLRNSIASNGGLGIDLSGGSEDASGVTANDPGDADTGPNGLQNFPVILAAESGSTTRVRGTLESLPDTEYTIDVYANEEADDSGFGEGQRWLGSVICTTDSLGAADFDTVLSAVTLPGEEVTATVTDPDGSTSEFSSAVVAVDVDAIIDLGTVEFLQLSEQPLAEGDLWYRVSTHRDGILTVLASADSTLELSLYSNTWSEPLATVSATPDAKLRIDEEVSADTLFYIRISGAAEEFEITFANLVNHDGEQVLVLGTAASDTFRYDASPSCVVTINGVPYEYDKAEVNQIAFFGGSNDDSVELFGGQGDAVAEFFPDHGTFSENGLTVAVSEVNRITAHGGGGADSVFMYDSPGDDTFVSRKGYGKLLGDGFALETFDFMYNYGYATTRNGGNDVALMEDTPTADKFKFDWPKPGQFFGKMYGGGVYYNRAKNFEQIVATMTDGKNRARLFDSEGNDVFYGQKNESRMVGNGFDVSISGYDTLAAYASTGLDIAHLEDSDDDDTTRARPHKITLWGGDDANPTYEVMARKFDQYHFEAKHGGTNRAKLHDTALSDHVHASGSSASLYRNSSDLELLYEVVAFDWVRLYATDNGSEDTLEAEDPLDFELVYDPEMWKNTP